MKGLSFQQPEEVIPQYKWLTHQCDVNVLFTHVGYENDLELSKQFPYYDLIVSSHSHTQLEGGEMHNGVLITQNGYQLPRVTLTTLEVENGKVVNKKAENIFINKTTRRSEAAEALLNHFKNSPEMEREVGAWRATSLPMMPRRDDVRCWVLSATAILLSKTMVVCVTMCSLLVP